MPVQLTPLSRRSFLAGAAALAAGPALAPRHAIAATPTRNPDRFALLSDTHVPSDPGKSNLFVNMTERMRHVVNEVVTLRDAPAAAIINGDCAFLKGKEEDYEAFGATLDPLRRRSIPVHLVMGNHDDRETCARVLSGGARPQRLPVEDRRCGVIPTARANFFLLDSLRKTNGTAGELGLAQLKWLARELDARRDKPAIVFGHHHPDFNADHDLRTQGLIDTASLMAVIERRRHVAAYVYGHTHKWEFDQRSGIHLINLPPTSYVFNRSRPAGWVDLHLRDAGATLTLHCVDHSHAEHGRTLNLTWRRA